MSYDGVSWAWKRPVKTSAQRVVLLALGEAHGHYDRICRPSVDTISEMCRMHRSTVLRTLRSLADEGHIEVSSGGGRAASRYTLIGLDGAEPTPRSGSTMQPQDDSPEPHSGSTVQPQGDAAETRSGRTVLPQGSHSATAPVASCTVVVAQCDPHQEHQVIHQEQQRASAPETAAADSPITAAEFDPDLELLEAILADRPDLAETLPDVIARFRAYAWKRRRWRGEWATCLRNWCAREDLPPAPSGPADPAWLRGRVATLLRLPDTALEAQLTDDPAMRALFETAGGADGVAALSPDEWVARYRETRPGGRPRHGPLALVPTTNAGSVTA